MLDPLVGLTLALALAALFAASALGKLRSLDEWPGIVRDYRVLPEGLLGAAIVLLPLTEGLTAAALLTPRARHAGAVAAAALLVSFAAALAVNLARGRTAIDCGCFGSRLRHGIAPWMVGRNLALAALALALLLPASGRTLAPVELACAALFAATLALLYPVLATVLQPAPPTFDENFRGARLQR